jgi:hypothetical protein
MKKQKEIFPNQLSFTSIPITMYFDETRQKLASATGFIYERNEKLYLITNWHNVTGKNPITKDPLGNNGGIPDVLVFTLLTAKTDKIEWKNFEINLYDNNKNAEWLVHPVHNELVDVIALEIEFDDEFDGVFRPLNKIPFDNYKIEVSDDVYILGFPYELNGGGYFPIWKRASIASEPDIDYDGLPKIFVDTASRSGMSGSPVIYRRTGIHNTDNGQLTLKTVIGTIQGFVGVYSGRIGKSELDAQLGVVWKKEVIDEIIDGNTTDKIKVW